MPRFDLPLSELRRYRPDVAEPADFDEFWKHTLADARAFDEAPTVTPVPGPLTAVDVFDLRFPGFGGQSIAAWYLVPVGSSGPLPTVIEYNGYNGGRGLPHERLAWVSAGYAYLFMDTRGQGSGWGTGGITPDPEGSGPAAPGFLTRGIDSAGSYYYRRVFTDAVRLVDAARQLDRVDPERISVCGGSQGGGITLAVAGLVDGLVAALPDVPFLCHIERAVELTDADPYAELVRYLAVHRDGVERTFRTLGYFDGVNFARRAAVPALFSVALMDQVCPPSTVFAAFNHYRGPREITVHPFNEHEGGAGSSWPGQVAWLAEILAGRRPSAPNRSDQYIRADRSPT